LTSFEFSSPLGSIGLIAFAYGDIVYIYDVPKTQRPFPASWKISYEILETILKHNFDNDGMVERVIVYSLVENQERRIRRRFSDKDTSDWYQPPMGAILIQMEGSYRNEALESMFAQKLLMEIYGPKKDKSNFEPILRHRPINLDGFRREMAIRQNLPVH